MDPLANDEAGDPAVPLDPASLTLLDGNGDPVDSVTVPGEGVYTIEDGKIVFTPEPDFTGTATPVDYQVADVNGTTARSTYTPTVAPDRPSIALDKTTGRYTDKPPRGGSAGDTLVYRFRVTNTGNTVLHDIAVHDPMLGGPVACGSGPLAPGTSRDCADVTYTLRSGDAGTSLRNTAEVTAQSPEGRTTSAADTVIYEVPPASGPTPAPAPAPGAVDGVAGGSGALPATGSAVSPGYVGAGLAALLGGLALAWYGRRQHRPRRRG
ncbi:DUF7507 domain-containing protein [Pimelobacter simplex]|uniref:DUF7507 domain-containing protein n=1 Tax=Nocardioides simplex TaxID=2045 RepID=UPI003F53F178